MVIRFRISLWPIIPSEYFLLRGYFLCFDNAVMYYCDPRNDNVNNNVLRTAYESLFAFPPGIFGIFLTAPKERHLIRFRIISYVFPTYAGSSTHKLPAISELIHYRIVLNIRGRTIPASSPFPYIKRKSFAARNRRTRAHSISARQK